MSWVWTSVDERHLLEAVKDMDFVEPQPTII